LIQSGDGVKITDVTLTFFSWDGLPSISYGLTIHSRGGSSLLALLTILTDEGVTGYSLLGSAIRSAEVDGRLLIRILKPILIGQDPLDRERIGQKLWASARATSVRVVGAVDTALWDLAGKAANMPIHQLLGSYRHSLPAYVSSPLYSSDREYCDEAVRYKSQGIQAYKIHAPHPWATDISVCESVRKAVGSDLRLMLDATGSYDYPTALRVGRALEELRFYWFEDPLSDWDIYNYVKLRQKLDVPLMATELPFIGLEQFGPWIVAQATDYLRGDVAFKGGITTMMKSAHLAEAFHMNYEIHHGGNSLNNVANLHVAMAIKNCEYFEVLLPDNANKYGLVQDLEVDKEGLVHAPMKPGLGVEIDFDLIKRNTQFVLE
jgi:L-alanine-DL-glutamate epimerase-like enolase superfamily enzyme